MQKLIISLLLSGGLAFSLSSHSETLKIDTAKPVFKNNTPIKPQLYKPKPNYTLQTKYKIKRFRKLDSNHRTLAKTASNWSCVSDVITGLMWENKTNNGKRWWNARYTNTTNTNNPPTARGSCVYSREAGKMVKDPSCHTEGYVEYINSLQNGAGLCAYNDWRMPSVTEMKTILLSTKPAPFFINSTFFPHSQMKNIWTGTPDTVGNNAMRLYLLHAISTVSQNRNAPTAVILVRGRNRSRN